MARPKQGKKRDKQFNVALTADEMATLRVRAAEAGQPLIEYGRTALFGKPITAQGAAPEISRDVRRLHEQIKRVGVNLNQIARHMNARPEHKAPPDLEPTIATIRRYLARVLSYGA